MTLITIFSQLPHKSYALPPPSELPPTSFIPPTPSALSSTLLSPPEQGDLALYSLGYYPIFSQSLGPTVLLLIDPSLYASQDSTAQINHLQHALTYLMDTPGLLADNIQMGIVQVADTQSDSDYAKHLVLPVTQLGAVASSKHPESQRYKIKNFINNPCADFSNCGSPLVDNWDVMAVKSKAAYAQAAAYMMGTDTHRVMVNNVSSVHRMGKDKDKVLPLNEMVIESYNTTNAKHDAIEQNDIKQNGTKRNTAKTVLPITRESVESRDVAKVMTVSFLNQQYPKPKYSQCSAKYFDSDNKPSSLDYKVGNAIIIIGSDIGAQSEAHTSFKALGISSTSISSITHPQLSDPLAMMAQSLLPKVSSQTSGKTSIDKYLLPERCHSQGGLNNLQADQAASVYGYCQQHYARHLNQFKDGSTIQHNPTNISIKTGVISFSAINKTIGFSGLNKGLPNYDCLTVSGAVKQQCLLGHYDKGYGEGGFFQSLNAMPSAITQSKALAEALLTMVNNLTAKDIAMAMTNPIQLANPVRSGEIFTDGYLSFVQPKFGKQQTQWSGGVKKYEHSRVGFIDKTGKRAPRPQQAVSAIIDSESVDAWSKRMLAVTSSAQVVQPFTQPHNVYLSQQGPGKLLPQSIESVTNLEWLGLTKVQQAELNKPLLDYMMDSSLPSGGVYHSTPIALISKASPIQVNRVGLLQNDADLEQGMPPKFQYKKHVLYGGMDHVIHIIDDNTGEEVAAYFAKEVMSHNAQYDQHKPIGNSTMTQSQLAMTRPSFGIDGPWTQYVRYRTDFNGHKLAKPLYVFGGARLGAKAYYGLDLTGLDNVVSASNLNGFAPRQLFTITPNRQDFGHDYFKRLGYSWGKPVITEINWFGRPTLVAILSGGYDATEYDKPNGLRQRYYADSDQHASLGNAVYIVDAKTGVPLIVASQTSIVGNLDESGFSVLSTGSGKVLQVANSSMVHSITGAVKIMDRDNDGLTDHLYFADLGGQLFRLDIDNVASSPGLASRARVVRLADFKANMTQPGPRFYETPVVTIQNHISQQGSSGKFATVTVASGDRSHPLRISDPSNQTVAIELAYLDNLGNEQQIKVINKAFVVPDDSLIPEIKSLNVESGDWQITASDLTLRIELKGGGPKGEVIQLEKGRFKLASHLVKPGSLITVTTTFSSTDKVNAIRLMPNIADANSYADSNNQNDTLLLSLTDPLSAKINLINHWVIIEPMTTAEMPSVSTTANYIYTLYDKDVATVGLFSTALNKLKTRNITLTENITLTGNDFPDLTQIEVANPEKSGYHKLGWRAPLTQYGQQVNNLEVNNHNTAMNSQNFLGSSIKAFGPIFALDNKIFVTAYNPVSSIMPLLNCRPQLIGSTELYQFCLPYGNCNTTDKSYSTHVQRIVYGKGMVPLSWKTDSTGQHRQLFRTVDLTYPSQAITETNSPQLLSPLNNPVTAPDFINSFKVKPQLKLEQWFDYSNAHAVSK
ncbi:hypothetical protein [Psychrobacter sanguinis]|uniref:hypothetical protein n=1 Tax=Psychrobacter sanguinis TaxID=861445 RepID=UPI002A74F377|nr:hypothetical protein [Psychrobacter sanguinis]MDY3307383.1 hypothetical protein [Psychrobacter sanguinis]